MLISPSVTTSMPDSTCRRTRSATASVIWRSSSVGVVGPAVLLLLHRVEQLVRAGQAADVGGQDAIGAALHGDFLAPVDAGDVGPAGLERRAAVEQHVHGVADQAQPVGDGLLARRAHRRSSRCRRPTRARRRCTSPAARTTRRTRASMLASRTDSTLSPASSKSRGSRPAAAGAGTPCRGRRRGRPSARRRRDQPVSGVRRDRCAPDPRRGRRPPTPSRRGSTRCAGPAGLRMLPELTSTRPPGRRARTHDATVSARSGYRWTALVDVM